jgi:uncharacterized protein YbjT (DUF2867 family)
MTILVTGGTGTLGRELVPVLRSRDAGVAVLSRRAHPAFRTGDLATGVGLAAALEGVDTVVHLAAGRHQLAEARNLLAASRAGGIRHLVFISIVGIDLVPLGYYRDKLAAEREIEQSGVPTSIQRTTQFHSFAAAPFLAQRRLPVLLAPRLSIQPIDTREVAAVLAGLALSEPGGRMPDLGGPQVLTGRQLAHTVSARYDWQKRIVDLALPGSTWGAFASGYHLVPSNRSGGRTFAEYLAQQ